MGLLPTKPSIPAQKLSEYFIVIFGEGGIGKTSWAIQFPNTVLFQFEEGDKGLMCYKINLIQEAKEKYGIDNYKGKVWNVFNEAVDELLKTNNRFEFVALDSGDRAYDFRMESFKEKENRHPGEGNDYGAGWNKFNAGYQDPINKLNESDYGLNVICHATTKERKNVKGEKVDKLIPAVGGQMGEWLTDEADITIFYDRDIDGNRIMRLESNGNFNAKQQLTFPDNVIPAGDSSEEAYQNFKKAFDKAIKNLNKKLGVTDEMIKEHYRQKERKIKISELKTKIKKVAKSKGLNGPKNAKIMEEQVGISSIKNLDYDSAKEYLDFLENDFE